MYSTDSYNWKVVSGTAAGTTTIKNDAGNLKGILIGQNQTGTVTLLDGTGTIAVLDNTIGTIPVTLDIGAHFRSSLIAVTGGTTSMTVLYN